MLSFRMRWSVVTLVTSLGLFGACGGQSVTQDGGGGDGTGAVGGFAGVGGTPFCVDPDVSLVDPTGNSLRATTTGANGSFTDSCDVAGDLLEHYCETQTTSQVTEQVVNCGPRSQCSEGACAVWCASVGDEVAVAIASTFGVTLSHSSGRILDCTATAKVGAADCDSQAISGHVLSVTSVSECDSTQMTLSVDDLTTTPGEDCTYSCVARVG